MSEPRLPRCLSDAQPIHIRQLACRAGDGTVRSAVELKVGVKNRREIYVKPKKLPAVMRERLVGVRHLVGVFSFLDRVSLVGRGVEQLAGQLLLHRSTVGAVAGGRD